MGDVVEFDVVLLLWFMLLLLLFMVPLPPPLSRPPPPLLGDADGAFDWFETTLASLSSVLPSSLSLFSQSDFNVSAASSDFRCMPVIKK